MRREPKSVVDVLYEIFKKADGVIGDGTQEIYRTGTDLDEKERREKYSLDYQSSWSSVVILANVFWARYPPNSSGVIRSVLSFLYPKG